MSTILMILKSAAVVSAAKTLGKAILTAALATLGVSWLSGCSSAAYNPRLGRPLIVDAASCTPHSALLRKLGLRPRGICV